MKLLNAVVISASIALFVGRAVAADAPKPLPAPPTAKVEMTAVDLQVALIAISNAGAACDIGVKQFCQVVAARDATVAKLQGALNGISAPQAPVAAK